MPRTLYDATPFLDEHPGGATSILLCGGTDCTDEFESIHSTKAWQMLKKYYFHAGKFGSIAGDTGITPVYQVMRAILQNPSDQTKVALIYCVRLERDLLLRKELEALQKLRPGQCRIFYTLSDLEELDDSHPMVRGWGQGKTRLTFAIVQHIIGSDADHVGMCGPGGMIEYACKPALAKQLGHDLETQTTVF